MLVLKRNLYFDCRLASNISYELCCGSVENAENEGIWSRNILHHVQAVSHLKLTYWIEKVAKFKIFIKKLTITETNKDYFLVLITKLVIFFKPDLKSEIDVLRVLVSACTRVHKKQSCTAFKSFRTVFAFQIREK